MQLIISTKPGLIGIATTPGQLNIQNRQARLEMHQEHAAIAIETKRPVLKIDQYEARAQLGYKKPADVVSEQAQLGKQKAMQFIESKTTEGNRLKAIEKGGNAIREIAMHKAWSQKQRQGGYTPIVGPSFYSRPAEVRIIPPQVKNPTHIGYEAEFVPGELDVQYTPGRVDIYMRQYPEVTIDVKL